MNTWTSVLLSLLLGFISIASPAAMPSKARTNKTIKTVRTVSQPSTNKTIQSDRSTDHRAYGTSEIPKSTYANMELKDFNSIIVGNNINLMILPTTKAQANNLLVFPRANPISIKWIGSTLMLEQPSWGQQTTVLAYVKQLHHLKVIGNGSAIIEKVPTYDLSIVNNTSGFINFTGNVRLHRLKQIGNGETRITWINAKDLNVSGQAGSIHLAGVVNNLKVHVHGDLLFDGEYLRSNKIWAHAHDSALLKLMPLNTLNASSANQAQIAYYHFLPKEKVSVFATESSNVLFVNPFAYAKRYYHNLSSKGYAKG